MTLAINALLVEENLLDAQLLTMLMGTASLTALSLHRASTVVEAIAYLSQTQVDVILLNLSYSEADNTASLQQLQDNVPLVPVIAIATAEHRSLAVAALQAGAQDYLITPDSCLQDPLSNPACVAVGNLFVTTLQNAIQRTKLVSQLAAIQERYTQAERQIQELAWQATHDPLTQLYNRTHFEQALDSLLASMQALELASMRSPTGHVLCYLDLDHFKVINDTCGHIAGDLLLQQVAALWRSRIRATDKLARLGGDEFGLLLTSCDVSCAKQIAETLCESIRDFRFSYGGKIFDIGVSIGLVEMTPAIASKEELLKLADFACYQAKEQGRSCTYVYEASAQQPTYAHADNSWHCSLTESTAKTLPSQLTQAFDTNQFQLYQEAIAPTETANAAIEHREVLIRLRNSQSGKLMPPMGFIPTAERYQLMPQIDRWVLQQVVRHVGRVSMATSADPSHLRYSINLSAASLSDDSFIEFLQQQLSYYGTPASSLCFEITETVAIANIQKTIHFTNGLKSLGCQVALDNFGSSISSLTYLKQLPLDYLKIDGRFIKEAVLDPITFTMLAAVQQVAQAMQIKTVAKCVESKSILETVKTLGMDFVQGYEIGMSESLMMGTPKVISQG